MAQDETTADRFAHHVKRILAERGMSRKALADAMGVTEPLVSRMLRTDEDEEKVLKTTTMDSVAAVLGVKVCELLAPIVPAAKTKKK